MLRRYSKIIQTPLQAKIFLHVFGFSTLEPSFYPNPKHAIYVNCEKNIIKKKQMLKKAGAECEAKLNIHVQII